ncbi:unnamed protein product [Ectocarpus sp. 6 AP-2014]
MRSQVLLLAAALPTAVCFTGFVPLPLTKYAGNRGQSGSVFPRWSSVPGTPDVFPPVESDIEIPQEESHGSILSNSALVAGNMIGAGVLALPSVTGAPGFVLSSTAMVVVWGYCLCSGMLVAECAGQGRSSVQEMAEASVGKTAGNFMCATFLMSNYLLMVAYICQGASSLPLFRPEFCGPVFTSCMKDFHLAPLLFTGLVGSVSLWGPARFVEAANTALVGLIAISFGGLVATGLPRVDVALLGLTPDASTLPAMLPVALCALTFQNVVPAVSKNLNGDARKIKASLAIGSGLPLMTYILWNAVVLGSTGSLDPNSAVEMVSPLDALAATSPALALLVSVFSISAIITSFWGAAFSLMIELTHLVDALMSERRIGILDTIGQFPMADDARSIDEVARHDQNVKLCATGLVLIPPTVVSMACPDSFLTALDYAGIYVDPFLYGLAPACMAYYMRSGDGHRAQLPGGTAGLAFVAVVTSGYIAWQTFLRMG